MESQFTAAWACWHVDLNNAAVQWRRTVETRPKPSFQISLTWQVSTRVRGVEIQSLVQYWIMTVCCRSKDHFRWTAPCAPCIPLVPKVGELSPHRPQPPVALPMLTRLTLPEFGYRAGRYDMGIMWVANF